MITMSEKKFDYKKEYKDLYLPKQKPSLIEVPKMKFIQVSGKGNPNTSEEYKNAMEILYGLSFGIKMSKMNGTQPEGYFEYVVPPLEGLWWVEDDKFDGMNITDKERFQWISMIRQPDFVTEDVFEKAKTDFVKKCMSKKKTVPDMSNVKFAEWEEGLCVQCLHVGPYDNEPETICAMNAFVQENGYENDFSKVRLHHEIYLGDPRRTAPERLKTVIRHPVKKV